MGILCAKAAGKENLFTLFDYHYIKVLLGKCRLGTVHAGGGCSLD